MLSTEEAYLALTSMQVRMELMNELISLPQDVFSILLRFMCLGDIPKFRRVSFQLFICIFRDAQVNYI